MLKYLTECITGKFGRYCNISCGHCLSKGQCHYTHGTCPNGCESGYEGSDCKQGNIIFRRLQKPDLI